MLDLNHPDTPLIFQAARQLDVILEAFKSFTRPTGDVKISLGRGLEAINELSELCEKLVQKKKTQAVTETLASLEQKLRIAANAPLGKTQDSKHCTRCGGELSDLKGFEKNPFCLPCIDVREPEMSKLDEEFGTWAI